MNYTFYMFYMDNQNRFGNYIFIYSVEFEEVGDAAQVGSGWRKAVCLVNERVEVRVGLHQVRGYRERIVEVGKRCVQMYPAAVRKKPHEGIDELWKDVL